MCIWVGILWGSGFSICERRRTRMICSHVYSILHVHVPKSELATLISFHSLAIYNTTPREKIRTSIVLRML